MDVVESIDELPEVVVETPAEEPEVVEEPTEEPTEEPEEPEGEPEEEPEEETEEEPEDAEEPEEGAEADAAEPEGEPDTEEPEEPEDGSDDDLDPLIDLDVYGETVQLPFSEVKARAQKFEAANQKFEEANQKVHEAEQKEAGVKAVLAQFQDLQNPGVGGIPRPFQAMIQLLAPMFGNDYVKAQQYLNAGPLQEYLKVAVDQHEKPGSAEIAWRSFSLEQKQKVLAQKEEQQSAAERQTAVDRRLQLAGPVFDKACRDMKIDRESPEGQEAEKALVARVVSGDTISYEQAATELKASAKGLEGLLERRLSQLSPDDLEKFAPGIGKELAKRHVARIKKARTTKGGKTGNRQKLSPTKSPRRKPKGQKFFDTIEELSHG